jgi:hypothetical protein
MKNIKRATALYIFLILLIIALANQGEYIYILKNLISQIPYGDKWGHFCLMGLLAFFVNILIVCDKFKVFGLSFLKGSAIILVIVTLEEVSQIWVVNRTFEFLDLTADYLGILVFGQIAWYFTHPKPARTEEE